MVKIKVLLTGSEEMTAENAESYEAALKCLHAYRSMLLFIQEEVQKAYDKAQNRPKAARAEDLTDLKAANIDAQELLKGLRIDNGAVILDPADND